MTSLNSLSHPLTNEQVEWLSDSSRLVNLGSKSRTGRTSALLIKCLQALIKPDQSILFVTSNTDLARDAAITVARVFESSDVLHELIIRKTQYVLELKNGSRLQYKAYSNNIGRGLRLNLLLLDNYALNRVRDIHLSLFHAVTSEGQILIAD